MDTNGFSLSDIASVVKDNDGGFGGGNGAWWIIILFLFVFMGGGGMFGRNDNAANAPATLGQMTDQFNFEALLRSNADLTAAVKDSGANVIGTVKDVAFNNLSGIRDIEAAVAQQGFAASQCCCETNRNIDSVRYENAQNTCAITTNATANTQLILDRLCQMENSRKDEIIAQQANRLNVLDTVSMVLNQQGRWLPYQGMVPSCGTICGCGV